MIFSTMRSTARGAHIHSYRTVAAGLFLLVNLATGQVPNRPDVQPSQDRVVPSTAPPTATSATDASQSAPTLNQPAGPTAEPTALPANVVEVAGSVEWARAGISVLAKDGWTPVKLNDKLEPTSQVRTGLRSHVNLKFGETTLISVRSATHASIDQFYRSATAEVVRLGLGYGTVRGGSSEGEVRADVIIDSTVATLAKRGTEGWQIQVEPVTGRFRISLAEYGLVDAVRKMREAGRASREVRPGEYATDANIGNLWIKQDIFNRNVSFFDSHATSSADAEFNASNTRGYSAMAPGGGAALTSYAARNNTDAIRQELDTGSGDRPNIVVVEPGTISRPDGNFGTGGVFASQTQSIRSTGRSTRARR